MRLCLQCSYTRYSKRRGICPNCGTHLTQVDGPLRKVIESLNRSEYKIAFAFCETYVSSEMCTAEILIGFAIDYDRFVVSDLPEHFEFISDRYGNQAPYTLNYVLNHIGRPMCVISFNYCGDPARHTPALVELKKAIEELYEWAIGIETTAKWAVYKLGGYL